MNQSLHLPTKKTLLGRCGGRNRIMIDYDYCEQRAMAEAMPIIAKAVENVPQKAEAREMITHYISVGVRPMKAQVFAQEMVEEQL